MAELYFGSTKVPGVKPPDSDYIVIPEEIKFAGWKITLPDGTTSIADNSYKESAYWLHEMILPSGVTSIGTEAFKNCFNLAHINLPEGITSIGRNAFEGCKSLSQVRLPSTLTTLSSCCFRGCKSITDIVIPDGVTLIDGFCFDGCSISNVLDLPASVARLNSKSFAGCNISKVICRNPSILITDADVFEGCPIESFRILGKQTDDSQPVLNLPSSTVDGAVIYIEGNPPIFNGGLSGLTVTIYYDATNPMWQERVFNGVSSIYNIGGAQYIKWVAIDND